MSDPNSGYRLNFGGVMARSVASPLFWAGYGPALIAGFLGAWPVNRWMLSNSIKKPCH